MIVQLLPFRDLQRAILEGERIVSCLPDGQERDTIIASVKENRSMLPLYAEHRWAVRAWNARKNRQRPPDIVA
jgi:hypothetical protein